MAAARRTGRKAAPASGDREQRPNRASKLRLQSSRVPVNGTDAGIQRCNCYRPRRWRPPLPGLVAARRHPQQPAHWPRRVDGWFALTNPKVCAESTRSPDRNSPPPFLKISRSSRSWRFSRRSRPQLPALQGGQTIVATALVPVGLGDPVADRMRRALKLAASCSGLRPDQTSSIICRWNSGGYGARCLC